MMVIRDVAADEKLVKRSNQQLLRQRVEKERSRGAAKLREQHVAIAMRVSPPIFCAIISGSGLVPLVE